MRDDRTLPFSAHAIDAAAALRGGTGFAAAASLGLVVLAGIVAPGDAPGAWTWLRVLAIWLLVAVALAQVAGAASGRARPASPLVTWGALLLAVAISLTFPALATVLTILGVSVLLLTAPGGARQPVAFWVAVATITPLWVWSAFAAWDRWLLLLVPMAVVGLVSLEHAVRSGSGRGGPVERMAAWIGLLALAAIALLAALLGGIDASWITAAAIVTAALGGADLALAASGPRQWPVLLPAVALGALALGWMAAL